MTVPEVHDSIVVGIDTPKHIHHLFWVEAVYNTDQEWEEVVYQPDLIDFERTK